MRPAVTVIFSDDSEGHDHPQPVTVAASATGGYLQMERDRILTLLVNSTEELEVRVAKPAICAPAARRAAWARP